MHVLNGKWYVYEKGNYSGLIAFQECMRFLLSPEVGTIIVVTHVCSLAPAQQQSSLHRSFLVGRARETSRRGTGDPP